MTAGDWHRVTRLAVDIGNTRTKIGGFDPESLSQTLPQPIVLMDFETSAIDFGALQQLLPATALHWIVSSVHSGTEQSLADWVAEYRSADAYDRIGLESIPITIDVDQPHRVGIDRLLACVAANRLRSADQPAIVVTVGTAITVNLLTSDGTFAGGAILPGLQMSAKALADQTDALPHVRLPATDAPPSACGKNTEAAIASGLYWGAVGAVRELIGQMAKEIAPNHIFFAGGDAAILAREFDSGVEVHQHLVLSGAAICASNV